MKTLISTLLLTVLLSSCQKAPDAVVESLKLLGVSVETTGLNECSTIQFEQIQEDVTSSESAIILGNFIKDNNISKISFTNNREETFNCDAAVFVEDEMNIHAVCDKTTIENGDINLKETSIEIVDGEIKISTNSQMISKNIYLYSPPSLPSDQLSAFMTDITGTTESGEAYISLEMLDELSIDYDEVERLTNENFISTNCGPALIFDDIMSIIKSI